MGIVEKFSTGASVRRLEDERFVTGQGQYTDDVNIEGQVYMVVVRSPFAHATIKSINTDDVKAAEGVLGVYIGADFTAAGGARMQEGILSLMQMPRTTVAISMLRDAGLPYIVVLTDPTTGGVTASYAMLGDIQIAEPNALIGFAGQRVIQDTIREKLPEGFQRSEYLLDHGMLDMVVDRRELKKALVRSLNLLMA